MKNKNKRKTINRKARIRRTKAKISGTAQKPRAAVYRSLRHISVQLIDDIAGKTIVSVGDTAVSSKSKKSKSEIASAVGKLAAEKAKKAKITTVVFDRRCYKYHGRVKALADGMREGGLTF